MFVVLIKRFNGATSAVFCFFTRVSPLQEDELLGGDRRKKLLPETQSDMRFSTLSVVDHEK